MLDDDPFAVFPQTGRQAQFLLAALLLAVTPAALVSIPLPTHSVKFDFPRNDDPGAALVEHYARSGLMPLPRALPPSDPRAWHVLEVLPDRRMRLDGEDLDLVELFTRLAVIDQAGGWIDYRPHPEASYETFLELLAVSKRAMVVRMRLANRPFAGALDRGE